MDLQTDMVAIKAKANTRASGDPITAGKVYEIDELTGVKGSSKPLSREDAIKLVNIGKADPIASDNLDGVAKEAAADEKKAEADEKKTAADEKKSGGK